MAKQTINVGTSANTGGGDPLRNALIKVNENFNEVYTKLEALEDGNVVTDIKGNVFAEDSTLLVDAVNGNIPYSVLIDVPTIPTALSELAGDYQGSVFADDSTLLVDGVNGIIPADVINGTITNNIDTNTIATSSGNLSITADNYVYIDSENGGQVNIGTSSGIGDVLLGNTANGTDVQLFGRLAVKGGGVPTSSLGASGDFQGLFAVDNNYIYYCTATYNGSTNIWKRVAWSGDTW